MTRAPIAVCLALVMLLATASPASAARAERPDVGSGSLKVVFVAMDRSSDGRVGGLQQIYTASGDGSDVKRITSPADGNFYDWAVWAFNGTKIVYTQRAGEVPGG